MRAPYLLAFVVLAAACTTSKNAAPQVAENPAPTAPDLAVSANASNKHRTVLGPIDAADLTTSAAADTSDVSGASTASASATVRPPTEVVVQSVDPPVPPPQVVARAEAPRTGPVQAHPGALVRGPGPAPNPAAEPVKGHSMLPVWDDAIGRRPAAVSLMWGQSEITLNLYEPPRATPMQVEFSLDGGPWLAARYGRVVVPDLGVGSYQVRCVAWPSSGRTWVMEPVVLERTANGWRTK